MKKNKTNTADKKVLIKDTSSSYSEAFQQLQVNLDFSFIGEKDKVIAITSPLEPSKLTYAPDTYPYEPLYFILYQPFEYLSTTSTFVPLVNIPNLL